MKLSELKTDLNIPLQTKKEQRRLLSLDKQTQDCPECGEELYTSNPCPSCGWYDGDSPEVAGAGAAPNP